MLEEQLKNRASGVLDPFGFGALSLLVFVALQPNDSAALISRGATFASEVPTSLAVTLNLVLVFALLVLGKGVIFSGAFFCKSMPAKVDNVLTNLRLIPHPYSVEAYGSFSQRLQFCCGIIGLSFLFGASLLLDQVNELVYEGRVEARNLTTVFVALLCGFAARGWHERLLLQAELTGVQIVQSNSLVCSGSGKES